MLFCILSGIRITCKCLYMIRATVKKEWTKRFYDNFLISQPNPMIWPSLKSSLRDDSNEWNIIGFGWEIRKLAFWKLPILDLVCCPAHPFPTFPIPDCFLRACCTCTCNNYNLKMFAYLSCLFGYFYHSLEKILYFISHRFDW